MGGYNDIYLLALSDLAIVPTTFFLKEDWAIRGEKRRGLEIMTKPGSTNL
jgi:hypothetical protein